MKFKKHVDWKFLEKTLEIAILDISKEYMKILQLLVVR